MLDEPSMACSRGDAATRAHHQGVALRRHHDGGRAERGVAAPRSGSAYVRSRSLQITLRARGQQLSCRTTEEARQFRETGHSPICYCRSGERCDLLSKVARFNLQRRYPLSTRAFAKNDAMVPLATLVGVPEDPQSTAITIVVAAFTVVAFYDLPCSEFIARHKLKPSVK